MNLNATRCAWNDIYSINNNLSKVLGKHNLKAGF
jgi:hypothetical protein